MMRRFILIATMIAVTPLLSGCAVLKAADCATSVPTCLFFACQVKC